MTPKTNFSFEFYYAAPSASSPAERHKVMGVLGVSLRALLAAKDSAATVLVSDSHKGGENKLVAFVTTLQDAQMVGLLQGFCDAHGLRMVGVE